MQAGLATSVCFFAASACLTAPANLAASACLNASTCFLAASAALACTETSHGLVTTRILPRTTAELDDRAPSTETNGPGLSDAEERRGGGGRHLRVGGGGVHRGCSPRGQHGGHHELQQPRNQHEAGI